MNTMKLISGAVIAGMNPVAIVVMQMLLLFVTTPQCNTSLA